MNRLWLVVTAVGIIPAAAIGYLIGSSAPAETTEPVAVPVEAEPVVPEFPNLNLGPRQPGTWSWSELRGGECIEWLADAFQEGFDVVECTRPHEAEFVRASVIDTNADAPYPGDESVEQFATELCRDWGPDDLDGGDAFDDLVAEASFSLGKDAWERGDRLAGCFVRQLDGALFTERLVVP